MIDDVSVNLIDNDDDLLDIVPLKQADDSEFIGKRITEESALEKIIRIKEWGSDFWIARKETKAIGYAIGINQFPHYESQALYVAPRYRGNEIALKLKHAQITYAKSLACTDITAEIAGKNTASQRVQQKAGFTFEKRGTGYHVRRTLE